MHIATIALAIVFGILLVTVLAIIARKPGSSHVEPTTDDSPSKAPGKATIQTDGGPGSETPPK